MERSERTDILTILPFARGRLKMSDRSLSEFRILCEDEDDWYKFAKLAWLDDGDGVLLWEYGPQRKLSRHKDGNTYDGVVGEGSARSVTTRIPFSEIKHEEIRNVGIPSNLTQDLDPLGREPGPKDFTFSSTVLRASSATFAAEIVDDQNKRAVLDLWQKHPDYVSAQTAVSNEAGKSLVLTVLNSQTT